MSKEAPALDCRGFFVGSGWLKDQDHLPRDESDFHAGRKILALCGIKLITGLAALSGSRLRASGWSMSSSTEFIRPFFSCVQARANSCAHMEGSRAQSVAMDV